LNTVEWIRVLRYANLEELRECLNGMSQSKSMLIINKVPTEKTLEQKRKKGEECRDRKEVLNEMFKAISNAFGGKFKYELFLENEDLEGAEENNKEQYNLIKIFTFFRYSCVNTQMVRTWDEIVTFYNTEISDQSLSNQLNEMKLDFENKLEKIEYDIADYKHSFHIINIHNKLSYKYASDNNIILFDPKITKFISNFECCLTQEEYEHVSESLSMKNITISSEYMQRVVPGFIPPLDWSRKIEEDLNKLGEKRTSLKHQLAKCQGKIDEQKKLVEEQKAKIIRLENALVNPNQIKS